MQDAPHTPHTRTKSAVALVLTFTAGTVDIVGYLTVYHFFTANMTGNTVHFGNSLAFGHWVEAAKAGSILVSFLAGSVLGRAAIEVSARHRVRRAASITLLAEALCVAAFVSASPPLLNQHHLAASTGVLCGLLALLAAAMGLQTATLTRIGPLTVHTTFVTGMLNKLAQAVSQWLIWAHDERHKGAKFTSILRHSGEQPTLRVATLMAAIWFCYMAGALVGTILNSRWSVRTLYVAVFLLLVAVMVDQFRPLSLEEEHER
jgi:uncharacterized membrane protein YoaK (UPF0700 family)